MKILSKKFMLLLTVLSLALANLSGCGFPSIPGTNPKSITFFALDTVIQLTIYDKGKEVLLPEAKDLVTDYESLFSPTIPDSDIYRINHAEGEWVDVSDETVYLLEEALKYCERSDGLLDITILPVKELWDFTAEKPTVPADAELQKALSHVDFTAVELDGNRVRLTDKDAMLDLGCIAKGYIADSLRAFLTKNGVTSALLSLGGNVTTIGSKPDGSSFTVGIQKPFAETGTAITTVSCSDNYPEYNSVVTSGIYERCFEENGILYHHIIDTKTGYPIENDIASVTIHSTSSTQGDVLSTLCLLLGVEKSKEVIGSLYSVEAVFITKEGEIIHLYGLPDA